MPQGVVEWLLFTAIVPIGIFLIAVCWAIMIYLAIEFYREVTKLWRNR